MPPATLILPHEHVFLDLRTWESPGHGVAETEEVIRRVGPEISRVRKAGVTVIVEPTTLGVGRGWSMTGSAARGCPKALMMPSSSWS